MNILTRIGLAAALALVTIPVVIPQRSRLDQPQEGASTPEAGRVRAMTDSAAFLRQAAAGAEVRIAALPIGEASPQILERFRSLGALSAEESFDLSEQFVATRNALGDKLRALRLTMDRGDPGHLLREATLVERYESFSALLRCVHEGGYLTAERERSVRLRIPGYRVYHGVATKGGDVVQVLLPVPLAEYLELAVRNLRAFERQRQDRLIAGFNAKGFAARDQLLQIWEKLRVEHQQLTAAESAVLDPYLVVEHRFDLVTRTLRPRT